MPAAAFFTDSMELAVDGSNLFIRSKEQLKVAGRSDLRVLLYTRGKVILF